MQLENSIRAALPGSRRRIATRDQMFTFDAATTDAAGVFLVGELERLDQRYHGPLASVTWYRDLDVREDVTIADEFSSFTNSTFATAPSVSGSNKAWVGKVANQIVGVDLDIGKTIQPLTLWAMQLGWTIPELESAQKLGRPVDSQKYEGMMLKYNMDADEQAYIGDSALGLTGLFNNVNATNTGNATTGGWATATAAEMIADVQNMLVSAWQASGYAVVPTRVLAAPKGFSILQSTLVSSAGNMSVLEYLKVNNICYSINGKPLEILPCKWLTGTTNGNPKGLAATDSMFAYEKNPVRVRYPIVPLMRTPLEFRDLRQLVTYFGRLGQVEVVYPETVVLRSGL